MEGGEELGKRVPFMVAAARDKGVSARSGENEEVFRMHDCVDCAFALLEMVGIAVKKDRISMRLVKSEAIASAFHRDQIGRNVAVGAETCACQISMLSQIAQTHSILVLRNTMIFRAHFVVCYSIISKSCLHAFFKSKKKQCPLSLTLE